MRKQNEKTNFKHSIGNMLGIVLRTYKTDTGKKEFYAKWTLNTYTVTFDSQGGSKVDSQTVSHGGTVTEPTAPTYEG